MISINIMDMMILRLFKTSLYFLFLSVMSFLFLWIYIPSTLSGSTLFSKVIEMAQTAAPNVALIFLSLSALTAVFSAHKLWKWSKAETEVCYNCGGIVDLRSGRYGLYYKCLACNKGRKI